MKELVEELRNSQSLKVSWKINIAQAFKTEYNKVAKEKNSSYMHTKDIDEISKSAASKFIEDLIG